MLVILQNLITGMGAFCFTKFKFIDNFIVVAVECGT